MSGSGALVAHVEHLSAPERARYLAAYARRSVQHDPQGLAALIADLAGFQTHQATYYPTRLALILAQAAGDAVSLSHLAASPYRAIARSACAALARLDFSALLHLIPTVSPVALDAAITAVLRRRDPQDAEQLFAAVLALGDGRRAGRLLAACSEHTVREHLAGLDVYISWTHLIQRHPQLAWESLQASAGSAAARELWGSGHGARVALGLLRQDPAMWAPRIAALVREQGMPGAARDSLLGALLARHPQLRAHLSAELVWQAVGWCGRATARRILAAPDVTRQERERWAELAQGPETLVLLLRSAPMEEREALWRRFLGAGQQDGGQQDDYHQDPGRQNPSWAPSEAYLRAGQPGVGAALRALPPRVRRREATAILLAELAEASSGRGASFLLEYCVLADLGVAGPALRAAIAQEESAPQARVALLACAVGCGDAMAVEEALADIDLDTATSAELTAAMETWKQIAAAGAPLPQAPLERTLRAVMEARVEGYPRVTRWADDGLERTLAALTASLLAHGDRYRAVLDATVFASIAQRGDLELLSRVAGHLGTQAATSEPVASLTTTLLLDLDGGRLFCDDVAALLPHWLADPRTRYQRLRALVARYPRMALHRALWPYTSTKATDLLPPALLRGKGPKRRARAEPHRSWCPASCRGVRQWTTAQIDSFAQQLARLTTRARVDDGTGDKRWSPPGYYSGGPYGLRRALELAPLVPDAGASVLRPWLDAPAGKVRQAALLGLARCQPVRPVIDDVMAHAGIPGTTEALRYLGATLSRAEAATLLTAQAADARVGLRKSLVHAAADLGLFAELPVLMGAGPGRTVHRDVAGAAVSAALRHLDNPDAWPVLEQWLHRVPHAAELVPAVVPAAMPTAARRRFGNLVARLMAVTPQDLLTLPGQPGLAATAQDMRLVAIRVAVRWAGHAPVLGRELLTLAGRPLVGAVQASAASSGAAAGGAETSRAEKEHAAAIDALAEMSHNEQLVEYWLAALTQALAAHAGASNAEGRRRAWRDLLTLLDMHLGWFPASRAWETPVRAWDAMRPAFDLLARARDSVGRPMYVQMAVFLRVGYASRLGTAAAVEQLVAVARLCKGRPLLLSDAVADVRGWAAMDDWRPAWDRQTVADIAQRLVGADTGSGGPGGTNAHGVGASAGPARSGPAAGPIPPRSAELDALALAVIDGMKERRSGCDAALVQRLYEQLARSEHPLVAAIAQVRAGGGPRTYAEGPATSWLFETL